MADTKISALPAATTPLAGTEVLPLVQSGATVKVANNDLRPKQIQSNATSGVLQVTGPAAGATRTMTVPDANFTAARTDAANSFTGDQTLTNGNLRVGTSNANGDLANTKSTTSGLFQTLSGTTASLAGGATEDITGLISGAAYLVTCRGSSNTTTFVIHTVYVNGSGGVTLATLSNGNGFVLTSPANNTLRVTSLVTTQTYPYTLTRIF